MYQHLESIEIVLVKKNYQAITNQSAQNSTIIQLHLIKIRDVTSTSIYSHFTERKLNLMDVMNKLK